MNSFQLLRYCYLELNHIERIKTLDILLYFSKFVNDEILNFNEKQIRFFNEETPID